MTLRQKPKATNAMRVYNQILFQRKDGWVMTVYAQDKAGRKWAAHVPIDEPYLLPGEVLAPDEWEEVSGG